MVHYINKLNARFCIQQISQKKNWLANGYSTLTTLSEQSGIRRIILNNPSKRNALSLSMIEELKSNISKNVDDSLRCVIISAQGPVFSSGHDLSELKSDDTAFHQKLFSTCTEMITAIRNLPVPVIAQVNGIAAAAGCQLIASCDIVVASEKSTFSTPGANVGIFCSTPGIAVARAVPRKISSYMLFTGLSISAKEALQCGLVSRVVSEHELEQETQRIAEAICSKSRAVIKLGKEFYIKQLEQDVDSAYKNGEKVMVDNLRLQDAQNGLKSFLEKKKPVWNHGDHKAH